MIREVDKLRRILEKRWEERERYRNEQRSKGERELEITSAPQVVPELGFWCEDCESDFTAYGYKCVESDWTLPGFRIAYYKGLCPEGHLSKRRITDKPLDPYFISSTLLKRQRIDHRKDILQQDDFGFKMMYGYGE